MGRGDDLTTEGLAAINAFYQRHREELDLRWAIGAGRALTLLPASFRPTTDRGVANALKAEMPLADASPREWVHARLRAKRGRSRGMRRCQLNKRDATGSRHEMDFNAKRSRLKKPSRLPPKRKKSRNQLSSKCGNRLFCRKPFGSATSFGRKEATMGNSKAEDERKR